MQCPIMKIFGNQSPRMLAYVRGPRQLDFSGNRLIPCAEIQAQGQTLPSVTQDCKPRRSGRRAERAVSESGLGRAAPEPPLVGEDRADRQRWSRASRIARGSGWFDAARRAGTDGGGVPALVFRGPASRRWRNRGRRRASRRHAAWFRRRRMPTGSAPAGLAPSPLPRR